MRISTCFAIASEMICARATSEVGTDLSAAHIGVSLMPRKPICQTTSGNFAYARAASRHMSSTSRGWLK